MLTADRVGGAVDAMRWPERFVSFLVAVVSVVGMWLLADVRGAVGIARADDWSYLLTQFDFGRTAEFTLNNWAVTMLIGQTITAYPLTILVGSSIAWHQVFVALFAVFGLWTAYLFIRRYLTTGWSALSVGTLAFGPLFAPSAISFMTDVPAFALMSTALLVGAHALDRLKPSWALFILSLLLSLVAFTFRDYAIMAGLTVAVVALVKARTSQRAIAGVLGSLIALVVVAGGLYIWRHSLPYDLKLPGWPLDYSFALLGRASITAALLISPALIFISIKELLVTARKSRWALAVGVTIWVALVAMSGLQFLGNVIHPFGTTWLLTGPGIRMWPLGINRLILVSGAGFLLVLLIFLVALVLRWWTSQATLGERTSVLTAWVGRNSGLSILVLFPAALFMAHTFATLVFGTWWIDRYFILWIPFACAGLLATAIRGHWLISFDRNRGLAAMLRRAIAFVWLVAFFVMSLHVVDFDALVDGTKWQAAVDVADETGVDRSAVDGGMPFVAFYETSAGIGAQDVPTRAGRPWWIERYPDRNFCWTLGFAPTLEQVPAEATSSSEFRSVLGAGGYTYAVPGPDLCAESM